jgi:UDP-N-acetylglucosamine 2-epimerase (non-hydrolysing)
MGVVLDWCFTIITNQGVTRDPNPELILREVTERPEVVHAGGAKLVGTNPDAIIAETSRLLEDGEAYNLMSRIPNPFGDGHAAQRIVDFIRRAFIDDNNTGGLCSHASK